MHIIPYLGYLLRIITALLVTIHGVLKYYLSALILFLLLDYKREGEISTSSIDTHILDAVLCCS